PTLTPSSAWNRVAMLEQKLEDLAKHQKSRDLTFGTLNYYEMGSGDNHTFLLHGMGPSNNARMFAKLLDSWAEHMHLYVIDMPGFGGSTRHLEYGPTFEVMIDSLREFMDTEQ